MPHADTSLVPDTIKTKTDFWEHVYAQLESLIEGQRSWVSNLANASALIYFSLRSFEPFGTDEGAVNWCGFYLDSTIFPSIEPTSQTASKNSPEKTLLLAPFSGKPACQFIPIYPASSGKRSGVCADGFSQRETLVVQNVDEYPGHIACDGETKSEIVVPLILRSGGADERVLGVLDLDCLAVGGFNDDDRLGLERIAELLVKSSAW